MNKKILSLFLGLCLIFSFGIMSCSENGTSSSEVYLNVFMDSQPNTLDPSKGGDSYGGTVIMNIMEPLIRVNEDEGGNTFLVPAGAESWDVSEDGLTYTFHLRANKWNDGKDVTSEDYAYGIRRSADPATACMTSNFLFSLKNGKAVVAGEKSLEELGVATPDEKTLVLTLENPVPYFLSHCCQRTYYPQRKDLVEKYGDLYSTSPENTPQCGPFILTDWVINSQINFVKNENYWNAVNVTLDTITCKIISDTNAIYNALMTDGLDYASVSDPNWRGKFESNDEFTHSVIYDTGTNFIIFNNTEGKITSNAKIRQAISVSIDRKDFIKTTRDGVGVPAYSMVPIPVSCQGRQFSFEEQGPVKDLIAEISDPKAHFIEGLRELGITDAPEDITIEYMVPGTDQKMRIEAEYFQQVMKEKLGINIKVSMHEWNEFFNRLNSKDYEFGSLRFGAYFNDPGNFFDLAWPPAKMLDSGWNNADYNDCVLKAQTELDLEKRYNLFKRADEILCKEDAEYMPLTTFVSYMFHKKYVKNIPTAPFNTMGWQPIDTQDRP